MAEPVGLMRLGAIQQCERTCERHGTATTDAVVIVCVEGENVSGENAQEATLLVFESEAQAKAYWDRVKDRLAAGDTLESTNYAAASGFKSKISGLKR